MNKQEAIEKIEKLDEHYGISQGVYLKKRDVVNIISQIHEPQKVVVPKFVAEWIEELKKCHSNLAWVWQVYPNEPKVKNWLEANTEKFMRAWLAYPNITVEQEKLYTVEIPNPNLNAHVVLQKTGDGLVLVTVGNAGWAEWESSKLTEAEIKQDFEWAWQWAKPVEEK